MFERLFVANFTMRKSFAVFHVLLSDGCHYFCLFFVLFRLAVLVVVMVVASFLFFCLHKDDDDDDANWTTLDCPLSRVLRKQESSESKRYLCESKLIIQRVKKREPNSLSLLGEQKTISVKTKLLVQCEELPKQQQWQWFMVLWSSWARPLIRIRAPSLASSLAIIKRPFTIRLSSASSTSYLSFLPSRCIHTHEHIYYSTTTTTADTCTHPLLLLV